MPQINEDVTHLIGLFCFLLLALPGLSTEEEEGRAAGEELLVVDTGMVAEEGTGEDEDEEAEAAPAARSTSSSTKKCPRPSTRGGGMGGG